MAVTGSVALGGQNGANRDSRGTSGRAYGAGHRVPGPCLPQRLRAGPAVQRAGGRVHDPAPGQADPVARADGAHRDPVPQVRGVVRVVERDPVGEVRQGRPQDRRDAAAHCGAGRHGKIRGGGDRRLAGVPAGVVRLPARHEGRGPAVHVREGRPPGDLLLLLPVGRGLRAGRSSRSAPTSPTRPRSGSTATSGPSGRRPRPVSGSPSWPTGSRRATTRPRCRRSATGSSRAPSRSSLSGGCTGSPCPSEARTAMPGTGGSAR